jgi:glutaredoxin
MRRALYPALTFAWLCAWGLCACGGNPLPKDLGELADNSAPAAEGAAAGNKQEAGEAVVPPFALQGELDGLMLTWFDDKGLHSADKRSDIPEEHRKQVRVDSLTVAPDKRLDSDHVYVADLSAPAGNGSYAVRKHTRVWFEAQADALGAPVAMPAAAGAGGDVTMYMASWCGACKAAARYMTSRGVPFVEKDIEKDAAANDEMQKKAHAAGKSPRGVPVIDFRGNIILGFDQSEIDRLIQQGKPI